MADSIRIRQLKNLGLVLLLTLVVAGAALVYVSQERTFYGWDLANYQNIAYRLTDQWRESPAQAFAALNASWTADYNALFALPLVPFLTAWGKSRLVFELALALIYLVPFSLVMGAIATRLLVGAPPRRVFWSAVGVTLLTPAVWAALLRGYPDVGAVTFMGLAVWLYTGYMASRRWVLLLPVGCLIALAILFRRHFAYMAVAFLVAAVVNSLLEIGMIARQRAPQVATQVLREVGGLLLVFGAVAVTLLLISREFAERVLTIDFAALYRSYERPIGVVAETYRMAFGWLAWLGAVSGYVIGLTQRTVTRAAVFVVVFGVTSAGLWLLVVRQLGLHYALHFVPLIVSGLVVLAWTIWLKMRGRMRTALLSTGCLLLGLNAITGLTSITAIKDSTLAALFAGQTAPLVSAEYDDAVRLLDYLHTVTSSYEPIYIVASSQAWNIDLLSNAEMARSGSMTLNFVNAPQVDSRDTYPLAALLKPQYVVVFEPFQHHLPVDEQEVVKVVYDLFVQPNSPLAADFAKLPVTFDFHDGVSVAVYKRVQPASLETILALWQYIRAAVPEQPGGQQDWIYLGQTDSRSINPKEGGSYSIRVHPVAPAGLARNTTLYLRDLPATVNVSGTVRFIDEECRAVMLRFSTATAQPGLVVAEIPYQRSGTSEFQFSFARDAAQSLLLDVFSADPAQNLETCFVRVNLIVAD